MDNHNEKEHYQDFKEMFHDEKEKINNDNDTKQFRKKMMPRHIIAVSIYVAGMFLIALLVMMIVGSVPGAIETLSPEHQVVREVLTDNNGIAFIDQTEYQKYEQTYKKYLIKYQYDTYFIIINHNNKKDFEKAFLVKNEDEKLVINQESIDKFSAGELKEWSDKRMIMLYRTNEEGLANPNFITNFELINDTVLLNEVRTYSNGAQNVGNFVTYLILLASIGYVLWPNIKKDFKPYKEKDRSAYIAIFTSFAIVYGFAVASGLIQRLLNLIFKIPGGEAMNQISIEMSLRGSGAPLMILAAVVMGPIVEELIFRKAIFELSRNKWVGLAISSFVFGLIHVSTELGNLANFGHFLYVFIPYLTMGIGFGMAYITFKENVVTTIGAHILWNAIALIVSVIS